MRNRVVYKDPLGSSLNSLFDRYGDWGKVADAASRTGGKDLGL